MTPKSPTPPPKKRFNMHLSQELHDAFKAATAAEGKQMSDVVLEFIRNYVEARQPERGRRGGERR